MFDQFLTTRNAGFEDLRVVQGRINHVLRCIDDNLVFQFHFFGLSLNNREI